MTGEPTRDGYTVDQQREMAQRLFPEQWAAAAKLTGMRGQRSRQRLRIAAVEHAILAPLQEAGASCASCKHFGRYPGEPKKRICEAESDFHGYALAKPDGLCRHWGPRP